MSQPREPILNVPAAIVAVLLLLAAVHAVRVLLLSPDTDQWLLWRFAFIPARYDATPLPGGLVPGGIGAQVWTFVTYALLHADLTHLGFNSIWLVAFGSPVARRFGSIRFWAFSAVTAVGGALIHLATNAGEVAPMIGASATVSGMMGAATRFAFQPGGSLDMWRPPDVDPDRIPAAPLLAALRNPRVLAFVAVWFGANLIFGVGSLPIFGVNQSVAWQAHVGGFLAGLLLFAAFDPAPAQPPEPPPAPEGDPTLH